MIGCYGLGTWQPSTKPPGTSTSNYTDDVAKVDIHSIILNMMAGHDTSPSRTQGPSTCNISPTRSCTEVTAVRRIGGARGNLSNYRMFPEHAQNIARSTDQVSSLLRGSGCTDRAAAHADLGDR
ncbi:hypothetical protein XELAEV_18031765mg [Xenopus laevis]|uniref:Uncharacterized protein n=1 Tax=Xenopus laevis TaxID=8355 RepID=A0A974HFY4_XENLA|nr:hypothetical protein XELAEV_18031765mg [Xenopus laevis]